jgi:hypothetical protein
MKLSISNIGWSEKDNFVVFQLMKKYKYSGLEIAPTRIFPVSPYDHLEEAAMWSKDLYQRYGFSIPSMQSIWYGRHERIFGTKEERQVLLDYTKKAIDFAHAVGCKNLVFGCPKNRVLPEDAEKITAVPFFKELGDYAYLKDTVIGLEANPSIYNTNYINDTKLALELIRQVDSEGFKLNLDTGTMIFNGESINELIGNVKYINHVHISEPYLKPIEERGLHNELKNILLSEGYRGYISIEMSTIDDLNILDKKLQYINHIYL